MTHPRLSFIIFALAVALSPLLPVAADTPATSHQLYLPQVIGPDNRGVTNFGCISGQAVNYTWFVSNAGTLQSDWLFVNAIGEIQWVSRVILAPQRGFLSTRMVPAPGWRVARVSWVYSGTAQTASWGCG